MKSVFVSSGCGACVAVLSSYHRLMTIVAYSCHCDELLCVVGCCRWMWSMCGDAVKLQSRDEASEGANCDFLSGAPVLH